MSPKMHWRQAGPVRTQRRRQTRWLLLMLLATVTVPAPKAVSQPAAPAPPTAPPAAAGHPGRHPQPTTPKLSITQTMAGLRQDEVALQVGEMKLTWGELQPLVKKSPVSESENARTAEENYEQQVKALLRRLATRGLLLHEVRARGITVTAEEKQANLEELQQGLKEGALGMSADDFLAQLTTTESTLLTLTPEDAQKVVKFGHQLFALIRLDDAEVEQRRRRDQGLRDMLKKQNDQRRQQLRELLADPEIRTDDGFARIARRTSEGAEARRGGELDMNFTRDELAKVNNIQQFTLQAGETSGLLETPTALRIMRVLREIPPEKTGEPPRLRVAQLLFMKFPEEDITLEETRKKLLLEKQKQFLDIAGRGLSQRYPVITPIFPQGLW